MRRSGAASWVLQPYASSARASGGRTISRAKGELSRLRGAETIGAASIAIATRSPAMAGRPAKRATLRAAMVAGDARIIGQVSRDFVGVLVELLAAGRNARGTDVAADPGAAHLRAAPAPRLERVRAARTKRARRQPPSRLRRGARRARGVHEEWPWDGQQP